MGNSSKTAKKVYDISEAEGKEKYGVMTCILVAEVLRCVINAFL